MQQPITATRRVYGNVLLYGVPSVADRSFVETVFQTKAIGRCLFFGFKEQRTVIAELLDKTEAREILSALRLPAAVFLGESTSKMEAKIEEMVRGVSSSTRRVEEDVLQEWRLSLTGAANEDNSLADYCLGYDARGESPGLETTPTEAHGSKYCYLHFLRFRRDRVHVSWSPLAVDAFYQSGGVVPEHAPNKKAEKRTRSNDNERDGVKGLRKKYPNDKEKDTSGETADALTVSNQDDVSKSNATGVKVQKQFSKDCCQKCGSPNHFSRHCDGSGPGEASTVTATAENNNTPSHSESTSVTKGGAGRGSNDPVGEDRTRRQTEPVAVAVTGNTVKKPFGKDQCQFCGSKDHFSRHCPQKP